MTIAATVQHYLDDCGIPYDTMTHPPAACSSRTAKVSHIPGECLAKAVIMTRTGGYLMAIIPGSRQVALDQLSAWLKQPVELADEKDVKGLFDDCEPGVVPPLGPAYGLRAVVDQELEGKDDIYFEAGDHRTLIHLSGADFRRLMAKVPHGHFSH